MSNQYTVQKWLTSDSPDWQQIQPLTINHYLWVANGYCPHVEVRLCRTNLSLHLLYRVYEKNPTIRYEQMNDPVYKDSCVEFFVQPTPEADDRYLNFEFNAAGTMLLGLGKDRNARKRPSVKPELFQIRTKTDCIDPKSREPYWELEFSIPFSWMQSQFPEFNLKSQTMIRANFYKCGDETPLPHYGSWNKILLETPDFHQSAYFGELIFSS